MNESQLTCHETRMGGGCMFMFFTRLYKEFGTKGTAPSAVKMHSLEMLQVIVNSTKFNRVTTVATGNL
jgi:hypothetical protein